MTEAEWLTCCEPGTLLSSLFSRTRGNGGATTPDERFRLFAIACCRRVERVLEFGDRYALDCLEIFARTGLRDALLKARRFHRPAGSAASHGLSNVDRTHRIARFLAEARSLATSAVWSCTKSKPTQAAMAYIEAARTAESIRLADDPAAVPHPGPDWQPASSAEFATQSNLLRDIFGNPFRPIVFSPSWRSESAVALARAAYDTRNFSLLPVLADALQDAGCESDDILGHCRGPGPHVRGCWVVDTALGKE